MGMTVPLFFYYLFAGFSILAVASLCVEWLQKLWAKYKTARAKKDPSDFRADAERQAVLARQQNTANAIAYVANVRRRNRVADKTIGDGEKSGLRHRPDHQPANPLGDRLDASRQLKAEQDAALEAAILADNPDELAAMREEVAKVARKEKELKNAILEKKKKFREFRQDRLTKDYNLPAEPEKGSEGAIKITVKLPSGVRHARMFQAHRDNVGTLHDWVNSLRVETLDKFEIVSPYPRRVLDDASQSLDDADVANSLLMVNGHVLSYTDF